MKKQRGGIATNIAYNLALLGERPRIMATVGQDFSDYRQWLEDNGIDTSSIVEIPNEFTASFFVSTDKEQNQIASFYTGAMAHAHTLSFKDHANGARMAVISPNDPGAMVMYARECIDLGIPYIYDPSQQIIRLEGEDLKAGVLGAQITIVNDYEFEMLKNKTGWTEDEARAAAGVLIVTRGEDGSTIYLTDRIVQIPAVKPKSQADPTGVGDAYRGGLLKGLLHGLDWETCGRLGALAATFALEEHGTQNHRYTLAEFLQRYQENFGTAPEFEK
jgi:adenosine kinase